jgi:hypothetical protein
MREKNQDREAMNNRGLEQTISSVGWDLLFIWTGVALLTRIGWGAWLLGVGLTILGAQAARSYYGLKWEGFSVGTGLFFVLGGVWDLFHIRLDFMPVLCIVIGAGLLRSALVGRIKNETSELNHSRPEISGE